MHRAVGDGRRLHRQARHGLADAERRLRGDDDQDRRAGLDRATTPTRAPWLLWPPGDSVTAAAAATLAAAVSAPAATRRTGRRRPAGMADGPKRLLEHGRAQELRLGRRACGEIAAVGAPAQVPVEQRRLEQGQNPVEPERNRFTRTVATCRSHGR